MAFSTDNVSELFPHAIVSGNVLCIPDVDINSCSGLLDSAVSQAGARELAFGLVDTLVGAIATGSMTYLTATETNTLPNSTTLRKGYSIVAQLQFDGDAVDNALDLKDEPAE